MENSWTTDPEYIDLLNYLIDKTKDVESPMSVLRMAKEFKEKKENSGAARSVRCLTQRIESARTKIHSLDHIDTDTKVKTLFALSASINPDFLKKLKKNAIVEVDEKNRITHYKANDRSLELRGDHSRSTKTITANLESKRSLLQSCIRSYFKNKNNSDAVPKSDAEMEVRSLIEFITEKCDNANSPLTIYQLARDFNKKFEIPRAFNCVYKRIRTYCRVIKKTESLDTHFKVKQLFGLSIPVDSDCLKGLRKNAIVEVDSKNRITKYTAIDNSLNLLGSHWGSKTRKPKRAKDGSEKESDNKGYRDSSDTYSSKEFNSEFDLDDENDNLDETEDFMEQSKEADDFDNETPVRRHSEMSLDNSFDFDPPTESSHGSDEIEMREGKENEFEITGNALVKTRYGRLSKRRHLDSNFSYNLASSASASPKPAKQKKMAVQRKQDSSSSDQSRSSSKRSSRNPSFSSISTESEENMENQEAPEAEKDPSYDGPYNDEIDDYDNNPRESNHPESTPIDNRLGEPKPPAAEEHNLNKEAQIIDKGSDADAPEPKPEKESLTLHIYQNSTLPTNGKGMCSIEVPIKTEQEEPIKVENFTVDVKPEVTHNFKIKFFNAMKSLILFLDDPSLSDLQSKIHKKIRNIKRSGEMISNDEMIPALELLATRMANHSVEKLPEDVKSVGLIQFFCYLKASILNSKMIGFKGLRENISNRIEESQNKRIPMEKVANALRDTLDIDGF